MSSKFVSRQVGFLPGKIGFYPCSFISGVFSFGGDTMLPGFNSQ